MNELIKKVRAFLYEFMKPEEDSEVYPEFRLLTIRKKIKEEFSVSDKKCYEIITKLLRSKLLENDFQDYCSYDHSLDDRIKFLYK